MKRKFKGMVVIGLVAAAAVTGCQSGSGNAGGQGPAAGGTAGGVSVSADVGTDAAQTSGTEEKTTIEYWHTNSETRGGPTVEAQVEAFNAQNDHIQVVARYNDGYDGLMKNLQADAAARKTPDLVQVSYSNIEYFPNNFPFTPADQVVEEAGSDKDFISNTFADNILALGTDSQGQLVGFPYAVSNPILYYNQDIFDEAGLDKAPETWQELRETAKIILEKTGKSPFHLQENDTWALQGLLECNGGKMLTWEGGKPSCTLADPKNVEAFQLYADMTLKDKTSIHISTDEALKAFNAGELGMLASSCANLAGIERSAAFTVGTARFPVFEGAGRAVPAGGCVLAVTAQDAAKKSAVMEFVEYLYQDSNITDWIEGTGYVAPTKSAPEYEGMKELLAADKLMEAASSQVGDIVPWAAYPGNSGLEAQQYIADARDQILGGTKDPQSALTDAQDKINALFK